ncbi:MAG: hypothetical protein JW943_04685 [Deltaproteobacteria bacterium]|nr:hypothetical protein [Deltaproteobacteria bacterium]
MKENTSSNQAQGEAQSFQDMVEEIQAKAWEIAAVIAGIIALVDRVSDDLQGRGLYGDCTMANVGELICIVMQKTDEMNNIFQVSHDRVDEIEKLQRDKRKLMFLQKK